MSTSGGETTVRSFVQDMVAGAASGIIAKTTSAPLERVKVVLQTQRNNLTLEAHDIAKGPIDCAVRVYRNEGILAFWRGNLANVYRYIPNQAINFAMKDTYKNTFAKLLAVNSQSTYGTIVLHNLLAGGVAGATAISVTYPLELARTRLAADVVGSKSVFDVKTVPELDGPRSTISKTRKISEVAAKLGLSNENRRYKGTFHCMHRTFAEEGLPGLYSGFGISIFGVVVFKALFLGGYDIVKYTFDLEHSGLMKRFFAAQILTTSVGTVCYPIDTVKRRMMVQLRQKSILSSTISSVVASDIRTAGSATLATTAAAAESIVHAATATAPSKVIPGVGGNRAVTGTSGVAPSGTRTYYRNAWHCFRTVLKDEGVRGLYSGLTVNFLRGISGAVLLVGYDEFKKLLQGLT